MTDRATHTRRYLARTRRRTEAEARELERKSMQKAQDEAWMDEALAQAQLAKEAGEVPIGAIVVIGGQVVGRGFNQPISSGDPTAHAEIVAIREAAKATGNYRLVDATLVVTIEPCLMCVGAMVHARVARLVFGAAEARTGAVLSTVRGVDLPGHNHRVEVESGIREEECRALMQEFFRDKREGGSGR